MAEIVKVKNKIAAIALLLLIIIFPLYYILFCDWCGGVLFSYFWGLAVMGGGTCFVYRRSSTAGIVCGIISLIILLLSARYLTFVCIWAAGALFISCGIWRDNKKTNKRAVFWIIAIFLIVGILGSIQAFNSMRQMIILRNISAMSVKSVIFQKDDMKIYISDPGIQQKILAGLQDSYAYLPNHEGIHQPWKITILLNNGREIAAKVGNSTKAYSDAVYIVFSGADYQSRILHKVLQPLLWPAKPSLKSSPSSK